MEHVVHGMQRGLFMTRSKGSSKQMNSDVLEETTSHRKRLHEEDHEDVGYE